MGVEALDAQPRAAFEVTQQRTGLVGQPAETAEAGVQHQMYGNGLAGAFGGAFEQCAALRAVYRGGQVQPQDGIGFGGRDGGRQHQNRRADARPAQRFRLVEVQNRQRGRTLVQQNPADRKQPGAVGVAFHHADNRHAVQLAPQNGGVPADLPRIDYISRHCFPSPRSPDLQD